MNRGNITPTLSEKEQENATLTADSSQREGEEASADRGSDQQPVVGLSIVVPVLNEAESLGDVLKQLLAYCDEHSARRVEIIVVDDGSSDESCRIAQMFSPRVKVLAHGVNRGYGSALVTGAKAASARRVVCFDADGQHTSDHLAAVLATKETFDMVVGARQKFEEPLVRRLGRSLIQALASYLVDFRIPDLNSGLRVVNREKFLELRHLYPRGFSLSSTVTLAFIKAGHAVCYVPINIERRAAGKSRVSLIRDGIQTVGLVVRLIMLFAPLKIFLPIAVVLFALGSASFVFEVFWSFNIGENTVLLLISSLLVFLFGLMADQVAAIRWELRSR